MLVEAVDVEAVALPDQCETRLAAEDVVAQPLRCLDLSGISGQQQGIARLGRRARARGRFFGGDEDRLSAHVTTVALLIS
jgi:hypothetical protein